MLLFLKPFTETLTTLYSEGVRINSPDIQETFICRGMLLCGTCDLPAKAIVYRIEQNFGGEKTLANLANRHNSPSFFANIPYKACGHAVCVVNV